MTTDNFKKWVWLARGLRYIVEAIFSAVALSLAFTACALLSATQYLVLSDGRAIVYKAGFGFCIMAIGGVLSLCGSFIIWLVGAAIIQGNCDLLFKQEINFQLRIALGCDSAIPPDAVKEPHVFTVIAPIIVAVAAGIKYLLCEFNTEISSEVAKMIMFTWNFRLLVYLIIVMFIASCILKVYLSLCRFLLERLLRRLQGMPTLMDVFRYIFTW